MSLNLTNAETITLLESFEDTVDVVSHLQPADGNRRIDEFSLSEDNDFGQITDGQKALKVAFSSMSGWQRDFQVQLSLDVTTLLQSVIETEETGRYYLLYDILWDNTDNDAGWANNPLEIGGWMYGDQIEWSGGGQVVTMAYEIGAGTPDGFRLGLVGDDNDRTFLNFIFNSNTGQPMNVYVDNIRLMDTKPGNAETIVSVLESFEASTSVLAGQGRTENIVQNEDQAFITHGAKSAKYTLNDADGGWAQDLTLDLSGYSLLAEVLEIPQADRARYTLAWDWLVQLDDGTGGGWGVQQTWSPDNQLTQSWAGDGGLRTRAINLSTVPWDAPPVLTIIQHGGWSGGNIQLYMDNIRIIDTGFVPSLIELTSPSLGGTSFSFSWVSSPGKLYQVHRSNAVNGPFDSIAEVTADGDLTTFADPAPVANNAFYQVANVPPAPIFEEDFETGAAGWTTQDLGESGTEWELGKPANGPGEAHSPTHAYGTGLVKDYGDYTDVYLVSPVIDLTGLDNARLEFWSYRDCEPMLEGEFMDWCQIMILDEDGEYLVDDPIWLRGGEATQWRLEKGKIPTEALGQKIRLEFNFSSDGGQDNGPQAGWFIDDVSITTK
jgi:hypothetical protein|tara:strand:+ start:175 stop:1992 length:1818 start_codon:yes stop_codon:yes gene_type:complete